MRQVVVLDKQVGSRVSYRYLLWAAVPAPRQGFYAKPTAWESAFSGRTAQEIADLRAGAVTERVETFASSENLTAAQVRAELEDRWTAFQAEVDAYNPWDRYGSYWDGTAWTAAGAS